ncbi:MAG: type II secretion system protein [Phycisphaerales bacterium]|nr:MAG: type II secretion system protein [Phycisphaerales bacterium]
MMRRGVFTLPERAILVIVLAIVAFVVGPRFSDAGVAESRMDDLCNSLQLLRSQIELYKVQHRDHPPMHTADRTVTFDPYFEQMVYCTDVEGRVKKEEPKTRRDDTYTFGPYLKEVPANPFNNSRVIVRARSRDDVPVAGGAGWAYVPESGDIYANDSAPHAGL